MKRAALAMLAACTMHGAELAGIWVGQMPGRNGGDPQDVAFKLTQDGAKIGGKIYGDYKSNAISEGMVSGNSVMFVIVIQEQAGNQINDTRVRYSGRLVDGQLELTRERERSTNAGNGGLQTQKNASQRQTFTLKRLL